MSNASFHSAADLLFPQVSVVQTEEKKRRSGKKQHLKRQRRQEREPLGDDTETHDTKDVEMPALEARSAGDKGLGLFARRNIMAGERLIQETPLFILPRMETMNAAIVESFMQLSPEQRAAYLGLSSYTTCTAKTQSRAAETSVAKDGAKESPDLGLPQSPVAKKGLPSESVDHRSRASDVQSPTSGSDTHHSCRSPNSVSGSGDHSLKKPCKLELSEIEAATSNPLAHETRIDSPVCDVDNLTKAFQATTIDSDVENGVDASDNDTDDCEMTESLAAQVVNIWRTNSYMLDDGITLGSAGVGLTASRLNHSCIPNVYTAYNSKTGYMTVQAVKPIAAGDELCTAYINGAAKSRSERRAELSLWGVHLHLHCLRRRPRRVSPPGYQDADGQNRRSQDADAARFCRPVGRPS